MPVRERDCFDYIIVQTYDVGLHSTRHPSLCVRDRACEVYVRGDRKGERREEGRERSRAMESAYYLYIYVCCYVTFISRHTAHTYNSQL